MREGLGAALSRLAAASGARLGVTGVEPFRADTERMLATREAGRAGPLGFTFNDPVLATDVTRTFPWARRLVVIGWGYLSGPAAVADTGPLIGRFATSDHYRGVREVAGRIMERLREEGHRAELLSDDSRLADRATAVRAGVGWRGRSTMVLAPGLGPWMLLGSVVTDAPLEIDQPMRRDCGVCVACIPACPTGAIDDAGLDARRCLSTWLQTPGYIPHWIRPRLGRRIYGCDDCLVACPPGGPALARGSDQSLELSFAGLLAMDDDALLSRFSWWYVPRRKGRIIRRNLLVAAGNSGEPAAVAVVEEHLGHRSSMIRGHAAWALARARGNAAATRLRDALEKETVAEARDELLLAVLLAEQPGSHREVLLAEERARMDPAIRGLALVGALAGGERVGEPELVLVGETGGVEELCLPMVRVYDPDRILEGARRDLTATGPE